MERARSIRPSVYMSAANLGYRHENGRGLLNRGGTCRRTVCPSTPVCSKLIPAEPSAQMMI